MSRIHCLLLLLFGLILSCLSVKAAPPDSLKTRELARFDAQFDPNTGLSGTVLRYNLYYAALLYDRSTGPDRPRADRILNTIIAYQDTVRQNRSYGQFPFGTDTKLGDQNVALFMAPYYFRELWPHRDRMNPQTASQFQQSAVRIVEAAERRWDEEVFDIKRDHVAYTNVFVMYINTLQLGGKYLQNERLLRMAEAQWARWFNHVSYYGIDEFTSPSYSNVDTENLIDMYEETRQPVMKQQVGQVLGLLATQQYGISHPLLKLPVCGSSRDYRAFQKPGRLEVDVVKRTDLESYQPPAGLVQEYGQRQFPYEVSGRATNTPFCYKSYQTANGGMGSMTGGNYFWQQVHLMVAVGKSENERDMAFLPGSFTPINGYVNQQGNSALCVFSRSPATYHRTQARLSDADVPATFGGFGVGVTAGWRETVNEPGRLVLTAYGQAMHVFPFTISNGNIVPVKLTYKKRDKISEKNYHQRAANFGEYVFPDSVTWVGCWITYQPINQQVTRPKLTYARTGNEHRFRAGDGSAIRLIELPTGEFVEQYDQDWRTLPLLQTPAQTIWPGQLTRRTANQPATK